MRSPADAPQAQISVAPAAEKLGVGASALPASVRAAADSPAGRRRAHDRRRPAKFTIGDTDEMAVLEIATLGEPILRSPAKPVGKITRQTQALIDDMIETM